MILFELVAPEHENSPNAVVYLQGQSYILFNKLQIKLDRVLDANEDWMGCYLDPGRIHFMMRRGDGMVAVAQSAKIVSTTTSERLMEEYDNNNNRDDDEHEDDNNNNRNEMRLSATSLL
jgi:hypothetical protein